MPAMRDFLERFRPAGAPGPAAAAVPADRPAELAAELEAVFALLNEAEAERLEISTRRTGSTTRWQVTLPGASEHIWIDANGTPVQNPRPHARTIADAAWMGAGAAGAVGFPLLVVYVAVRLRGNQHRRALWDADWERFSTRRTI